MIKKVLNQAPQQVNGRTLMPLALKGNPFFKPPAVPNVKTGQKVSLVKTDGSFPIRHVFALGQGLEFGRIQPVGAFCFEGDGLAGDIQVGLELAAQARQQRAQISHRLLW